MYPDLAKQLAPRGNRRIAVGMSGGVDSSVSAALLQSLGWEVTGVFLECWRGPGCRADEDRKDALSVALQLGIPFEVLDFKEAYRSSVVEYFFTEYAAGRTPNPDVLCNKEIKFGLFYDWAMQKGFDAVATGHYAQIQSVLNESGESAYGLFRGVDEKKDQSYFLYLLKEAQLAKTVFPVGGLQKPQVRALAQSFALPTATKPDSQGICFIGEIDVRGFLRDRLGEKPGDVVDTDGNVIGSHRGLWFYTIGQRHGFQLNAKYRAENGTWKHVVPPFYVIAKHAEKNHLIVGYGAQTLCDGFFVKRPHWIHTHDAHRMTAQHAFACGVRIRHGGKVWPASIALQSDENGEGMISVRLPEAIQGVADGQSAVFYADDGRCLGGGVISRNEV